MSDTPNAWILSVPRSQGRKADRSGDSEKNGELIFDSTSRTERVRKKKGHIFVRHQSTPLIILAVGQWQHKGFDFT